MYIYCCSVCTTLYKSKKPCLILLDHWLKWIVKSFSKCLSQVQTIKIASSKSRLASNSAFENRILFLSFQIGHVTASHQYLHLLALIPSIWIEMCWRKCCFGLNGRAPLIFIHDIDSHQIGWILIQWINRWDSSSLWLSYYFQT